MRRFAALALVAFIFACGRPAIDRGTGNPGNPDATGNVDSGFVVASACGSAEPLSLQAHTTDPRVKIVLDGMTLAEKVEQMAGFPTGAEMFATPDNDQAGIRGFRFRDGPRGVRTEPGTTATCFPVSVSRGATWDLDLERRVGAAIGAETRGLGHNFLLAPTVNILRHPGWGRAQETYGEDPWLLGRMGTASVLGIQEHVGACVKHYAANNIEDTRMSNNAVIDEQTLREVYTRPFEMIVKEADAACIMAAYNKVNGTYCCENKPLLRDILKTDWAFDGFVVSDWLAARSTVESALGGLDVEMPWALFYESLEQAVALDQVTPDVIDDAVRRILRIKFKFGFALLSEAYVGDATVVESPAHIALAREAAVKGMVLLKNRDAVLPVNPESIRSLAVVGEFATQVRLGDAGSSNVTPSYAVSPYAGISQRAAKDGITVTTSPDASAANGADLAIVVVALTQKDEGEAFNGGGDRDDLGLSGEQDALILEVVAAAERTIVVIEAGGPITMEGWVDRADGILMAWYPGMEGGNAIADVLFGDVNVSGRLIQTWPKRREDEPVFGNHKAETVMEYDHGYRHFDRQKIEPLFPFGFGLSYTTFAYSNLVIPCETITADGRLVVTVDIENTGTRAGVAVPQLYVGFPETTVRRPVKELKGFARVSLLAGETKTIEIPVRIPELAYWDATIHRWVVEEKRHDVYVGPDALDLPLTGSFTIGVEGKLAP